MTVKYLEQYPQDCYQSLINLSIIRRLETSWGPIKEYCGRNHFYIEAKVLNTMMTNKRNVNLLQRAIRRMAFLCALFFYFHFLITNYFCAINQALGHFKNNNMTKGMIRFVLVVSFFVFSMNNSKGSMGFGNSGRYQYSQSFGERFG